MNAKQVNKSRMYRATNQVLDDNLGLIDPNGALAEAHRQLKERLLLIEQNRMVQELDHTGLTRNKEQIREELSTLILRISAALKAHATAANDVVMKSKASYTPSDLKKAADPILCDIAAVIGKLASPLADVLPKYFVGAEEIAQLDLLTADFKGAIPLRRVATNITKASTGNISDVYDGIDRILKNTADPLMEPFRFTQPDFYNTYKNGRIIVDYTGRGKSATPAV